MSQDPTAGASWLCLGLCHSRAADKSHHRCLLIFAWHDAWHVIVMAPTQLRHAAAWPKKSLLSCLLASADRAAPNKQFLSNYLKGVESGNKRAIARNAARGAQQVKQQIRLNSAGCCSCQVQLLHSIIR